VGCERQKIVDFIYFTNSFYSTLLMPLEIKKNSKNYIVTRGPWVAHLRKRSKVTVEPIIENPRGII